MIATSGRPNSSKSVSREPTWSSGGTKFMCNPTSVRSNVELRGPAEQVLAIWDQCQKIVFGTNVRNVAHQCQKCFGPMSESYVRGTNVRNVSNQCQKCLWPMSERYGRSNVTQVRPLGQFRKQCYVTSCCVSMMTFLRRAFTTFSDRFWIQIGTELLNRFLALQVFTYR